MPFAPKVEHLPCFNLDLSDDGERRVGTRYSTNGDKLAL